MKLDATTPRRQRSVRALADRLQQHLRLQRELLWHPRLGLVGGRSAVPVRIPAAPRRSWTRR